MLEAAFVLPDALLLQLSRLLAERTGLHFPPARWSDLERGITSAASALGAVDTKSCAERLASKALTAREIEILATCFTVGETYFFRDEAAMEMLAERILPDLLRAREANGRQLRIWSAGCCTGEEIYSVAILLDCLRPNADSRNTMLLATDINPVFLSKAAEAEYGEWSFRNTPDWVRDRYFRRKDRRYKLEERIRRRVTFSRLNLADDTYPSYCNDTHAMDLVLCRNVLMYFCPERAAMVIDNMHRALVDGGWLVVSPAESSGQLFARFIPADSPVAGFYCKHAGTAAIGLENAPDASRSHPISSRTAVRTPALGQRSPKSTHAPETIANSGRVASSAADRNALCSEARSRADEGRLAEAAELCRRAIDSDKLDPRLHYLLSIVQQEQGDQDGAAQSLMRALYLDPHFVVADYTLGVLRRLQGRPEAQRHFENALASLQSYSPEEVLPESGGVTAKRFAELIASMQSSLHSHL